MDNAVLKSAIFTLALAVVIPDSFAKRVGAGRSIGEQSQFSRQRALPAPTPRPQQPVGVPPSYAGPAATRQSPPSVSPGQPLQRQAATPWGGMLGGALVGLGLGSLMSSGDRDANASGLTNSAGNTEEASANAVNQPTEGGSLGSFLLPLFLALIAFFVFRKIRSKPS